MLEYYISPDGNDQNPGTQAAPWKTLTKARDQVRSVVGSFESGRTKNITVHLAPGIHRLSETLILGPEDGGDGTFAIT
ncbi:hypothetical protein [Puniceicoccus vermicola]|uniref:Uncharacterized protein n=1 Tax=Puniceicoccus vermicola TaxID=388746 RepID=A0A7X1B290_9BACT|nr:hypothetical protein [Puniceicoccus vermicola]MBC2603223.1 hypothetical protein [Puniceicoccus vermicola]